jgi:hypothetical protein
MNGRTNTTGQTGAARRGGPGAGRRPRVDRDLALDSVQSEGMSSGGAEKQVGTTGKRHGPEKGGAGVDFPDTTVLGREKPHSAWAASQVGKVKHHKTRLMRCAKLLAHAIGAMEELRMQSVDVERVKAVRGVVMGEYWKEVERDRLRLKDYNRLKQKEHRKG